MKEMIWAYMLKLSDHMWEDEHSVNPNLFAPPRLYNPENSTDLEVWDDIIGFIAERKYNMVLVDVGDGIQYESHPEISAPNAWDKDFTRKKLNEMRSLGLEPIPKLNFSAAHDTWLGKYRRMLATPTYYRVCADLIREVCEVFDYPRYFQIGFDEESATAQDQAGWEMALVRNGELWWHDLFLIADECERHGARPWMWSDYMWWNLDMFLKKMPTSIMQSNYHYGYLTDYEKKPGFGYMQIESFRILDKYGFDQIPCVSNWKNCYNQDQILGLCKAECDERRIFGYLSAPWASTNDRMRYMLKNNAHLLYLARQELYPETL